MTKKDLDLWFNSLDLDALMIMFVCPPGRNATDFIDDCDEYWDGLTLEEKEEFYSRHN